MQAVIRLLFCAALAGPGPALAQATAAAAPGTATETGALVTDTGPRPPPVLRSPRPRPLGNAMTAVRRQGWENAARIAARDGAVAVAVVEWHRLRAGRGTLPEALAFLEHYPDWPGLGWLRRQAEAGLTGASASAVAAFFSGQSPQTPGGVLAFAEAMAALGQSGTGEAEIVLAWRTMDMSEEREAEFLGAHAELLQPHHPARVDMLIWRREGAAARRLFDLVPDDQRALAEARLAVLNGTPEADALVAALPAQLADHPGLAFARYDTLRRARKRTEAAELMRQRSRDAADLGEPDAWARHRLDLARRALSRDAPADAYELAALHGLTEGSRFAQLEWFAGFVALRHLQRPADAIRHFTRFADAVETPISLGRAGYWLGRAYEAAGNASAAQAAFAAGGQHQTSFYGLLAAEKAGLSPDPLLTGAESFLDWRDAAFTTSTVFEAAVLLYGSGEKTLAERFFLHLAEGLDRTQLGSLGAYFRELQDPHLQVMLGKRAASFGHTLPGPYYALHPLHLTDNPVPDELMLAIARRESEFDPRVVSGAGARGLMQVMPGTAREVAARLDLPYDADRLTSDPEYNARLGGAYLAGLAETFEGNIVMIAAGYNAGPSRPRRWMSERGDPRRGEVDVIDWIEAIPFDETRNYVMRVAESLPVYRARLGRAPHPIPFSQELVSGTMTFR